VARGIADFKFEISKGAGKQRNGYRRAPKVAAKRRSRFSTNSRPLSRCRRTTGLMSDLKAKTSLGPNGPTS
jgi:hypothetical protein